MEHLTTVLETKRLILRAWEASDAEELYKYAKDPAVGPIAGWPVHTSVENSLEIINGILSAPETYAVVLKETGLPVGSVGIMFEGKGSAPIGKDEAEIGYWIGVPYWGQGLIPEAVRELQHRCFEALGCKAVWCGYYDGNNKSRRVQEKCGFLYHHTVENAESPMGDLRTEHFTYMTKERFETISSLPQPVRPKPVILGTDWHTDCDDCVALRLLDRLERMGVVSLLGVCVNSIQPQSAASLAALLRADGAEKVPVGLDFSAEFEGVGRYQAGLAAHPSKYSDNSDCPDAVALYRQLLAAADKKVDMIEVGFEQTVEALLKSEADEFSPLNGMELVREKVGTLYAMAGKWDEENGREFNICCNSRSRAAAAFVADNFPAKIVYLGFEVGFEVRTGSRLPENDLLKQAMRDYGVGDNGHHSWDPMTALLAAIGDPNKAGYSSVTGTAKVNAETGENSFTPSADGIHSYVVKEKPDSFYVSLIDEIIL